MPDIETLRQKMEAAAQALDFEEARRLRDRITLMSGGAPASEAGNADHAGVRRQQPGAMGLGTGQPRVAPPADWIPPAKPDLKTRGQSRRDRRKPS
jgi:hypothetical protein